MMRRAGPAPPPTAAAITARRALVRGWQLEKEINASSGSETSMSDSDEYTGDFFPIQRTFD
jgi:hypothetical protein